MNKNAQILIGVAVLSVGGYLYWKSTQKPSTTTTATTTGTKANATGGLKKKKGKRNANGINTVPKNFFKVKSTPNAEGNFANASGDGIFANADGIFANASGDGIFANADGIFANASGDAIFANMVQPMATYNSGNTFM